MDIAAVVARSLVIPVLPIERAIDAVPLARALVKGGLPVLEITLRTDVPLEALKAVAAEAPHAVWQPPGPQGLPSCRVSEPSPRRWRWPAVAEQGSELMKFFPAKAAGGWLG